MKLMIILSSLIWANQLFAGTPQLTMDCKSKSVGMNISGYPRGEGYDLKIEINGHTLRYVDKCNDVYCSKREKRGDLYVVEALNRKVFTIYFVLPWDNGEIFMGYFYALPETVKYTKTTRGYRAQYKAVYDGADPRSETSPQAFVKNPVELTCTHEEEL